MSHETLRDRILDLAYGELDPREAGRVEEHARGCPECGAELARFREARRLVAGLPVEPAPEGGERILLAAAREAAERRKVRRGLPRWLLGFSVAAASIVAVGAISWRIAGMRPGPGKGDETALLGRGTPEAPPAESRPASPSETRVAPAQEAFAQRAAPDVGVEGEKAAAGAPRPRAPSAPRADREEKPMAGAADRSARALPSPDDPARKVVERFAAEPPRSVEPAARSAGSFAGAPRPEASAEAAPADGVLEASPSVARGASEEVPPASERFTLAPPAPAARPGAAAAVEAEAYAVPSRRASKAATRERAALPPGAGAPDARARYEALRAAGGLRREVRTFAGCEGETRREVELDAAGRVVRYVREGTIAGRRVRVEHLFGADGALAALEVQDLERPGVRVDGAILGASAPRREGEARADAPARCGTE